MAGTPGGSGAPTESCSTSCGARLIRKYAEAENEPTDELDDVVHSEPTIELGEDSHGQRAGDSDEMPRGDSTSDFEDVA